jgi:hypothetical protein
MASKNAENVAKKISENIRKGKKVILGEIIEESGYSESTSKSPQRVTETKSFKKAIEPLTDGLWREINKIKAEMEARDITDEKYETLSTVLDKLVKNYQLLSGGATERVENKLDQEQQAKLDIILNDKS